MDYYNENDPKIANWLRNLISAGLLPAGDVDTRSIEEVTPDDLRNYTRCHFFAGIGGWALALQLAEWPLDRPVWTGSCPCQPFSVAGAQKGYDDERHLWPVWADLIAACEPPAIFGEQVASPAGREWLGDVRNSLEALGYEVGAADLCAASVGAPHIRQRLYWVGISECERLQGQRWNEGSGGISEKSRSTHKANCSQWMGPEYIRCEFDGRLRPTKPGISLLAHGVRSRNTKFSGLGNAIVPQLAAAFIMASL